ncbi:fibronectin type III domain-containing protein [Candidatus Methylomirabilis sp.]|uniref:fibronectin type III domain-containing protein n=1 Tax=Candidatus Methylomirabilis sp. TaxID=2032687 RepID=UPI002A5D2417|nr:fibronectin type III domain-containing protein [Candidatus Methylomirabilis sp.]
MRIRQIVVAASLGLLVLSGCGRSGRPVVPILAEPSPPTDLTTLVRSHAVVLAWARPTTNIDGTALQYLAEFRISRQQIAPQPSPLSAIAIVKVEKPENAVVSGNRYAFTDSHVVVGGKYAYSIEAVSRRGIVGPPSAEATALVTVEVEAPSSLQAEAGERAVRLSWVAPTRRVDGSPLAVVLRYNIYRGASPGRYDPSPINREPVRGTQFQDANLVNDQTYYYRVTAVESQEPPWQEGLPSSEVSVAPVDLTPPAPPQGVRAVAGPGAVVSLSWELNREPDLLGYLVYRRDAVYLTPQRLTEAPLKSPILTDRSVQSGGRYTYTVTAVDASLRRNESVPSEAVEVLVP